jgi:exopolysaccharide biosynthesis protein
MRNLISSLIIIFAVSVTTLVIYSKPSESNISVQWKNVYQGIDYYETDYGKWFKKGKIHAVRITKPRKLKILKDTYKSTTLENLEKKYNPLVIVNGGYFQENFLPTGLLKINNKVISNLNKVGSSGILAINNTEVNIFHKKDLDKYKSYYSDLLQNGPLLVEDNGHMGIYKDDKEYSARTIIGTTKDNKTIILVADHDASPSLWEISSLLVKSESEGGFNCKMAINMDGGSSTGFRLNLPNKKVQVYELDYIANGIGIF